MFYNAPIVIFACSGVSCEPKERPLETTSPESFLWPGAYLQLQAKHMLGLWRKRRSLPQGDLKMAIGL